MTWQKKIENYNTEIQLKITSIIELAHLFKAVFLKPHT